jgi:hypothetical protein
MLIFRTLKLLRVSLAMVGDRYPRSQIILADLIFAVGEAVIRSHIAQTGLA